MNLKTGQDLPLTWTDWLRNLAIVRSFFMLGENSKPPALWEVLVFLFVFCLMLPTMLHVFGSIFDFGADLLAHFIAGVM